MRKHVSAFRHPLGIALLFLAFDAAAAMTGGGGGGGAPWESMGRNIISNLQGTPVILAAVFFVIVGGFTLMITSGKAVRMIGAAILGVSVATSAAAIVSRFSAGEDVTVNASATLIPSQAITPLSTAVATPVSRKH